MEVLLSSLTILGTWKLESLKLSLSHTAGRWQSQNDSTDLLHANVIAL